MLLQHDVLLGYKKPEMRFLSFNQLLTLFDPTKFDDKPNCKLVTGYIS